MTGPDSHHRASLPERFLAVLGGMAPDQADSRPAERRDHVQWGLLLITAGIGGGLSIGSFVSFVAPSLPSWVTVTGGVLGGLAVLVLQRALVLAVLRSPNPFRALLPIVVATLVGATLALPITAGIFDAEIRAAMANRAAERIDGMGAAEAEAADEVANRAEELDQARSGATLSEGALKATLDYEKALSRCEEAMTKATLELRGQLPASEGGSGRIGEGPGYQVLQRTADELCSLAKEAKAALDKAMEAELAQPVRDERIHQATDRLDAAQERLDFVRRQRDQLEEIAGRAVESPGLLARLDGWQALIEERGATAMMAYLIVTGVMTSVQIMPSLFTMLMQPRRRPGVPTES